MMLGPGRRNATAGGQESRPSPTQATLASVSDTSSVQICTLPTHHSIRGILPAFPTVWRRNRPRHRVRNRHYTSGGGSMVAKPGTPHPIVTSAPTPLA